ncbi:MAG: hypothetical protein IPJ65_37095 [Archangiaceae bacterium]|nr:hypothetical protein [Archangiaceae bacterium]
MKRIAVLALLAVGCRKEATQAPDAAAVPVAAVAAVDGGFVLTPALLDGYLRYQRASQGITRSLDGGTYDRAERDAAALKASGLSGDEVVRLDEMVSSVIARRMVTQLAANPEFMPDLAAMGQALNPEQKKHMEEAMAAFKQQQQQARELTDERKRFGTQNIDVLLSREAEVSKAWAEMMGMAPPPAAPR